jgi:menaquinone-9 beta-reductase
VQRRAYAAEHDDYYFALHSIESGWRDFFYGVGPELEAMRIRVLPQISRDPSRVPDLISLGPDAPRNERARRHFFAKG